MGAAALVVAALAPAAAATRSPRLKEFTVAAKAGPQSLTWEWDPSELTIRGKGRVTWENFTEAEHHVTFWEGPLEGTTLHLAAGGGSESLVLKKPGVHKYRCDLGLHSDIVYVGYERICVGQCGEITVE